MSNSNEESDVFFKTDRLQSLLHAHETLKKESARHRDMIFNAFNLSMAGLMVVLAGIIYANQMTLPLKMGVSIGVFFIVAFITKFICQQRKKSNEVMPNVVEIERKLEYNDNKKYSLKISPFPKNWFKEEKDWKGLAQGDWIHLRILWMMALIISIVMVLDGWNASPFRILLLVAIIGVGVLLFAISILMEATKKHSENNTELKKYKRSKCCYTVLLILAMLGLAVVLCLTGP